MVAGAPLAAQQADEALVAELARLLAAADARQFDAALLREALQHPNAGVRRQAALAAGRIGDPAAVDLLLPGLSDEDAGVQAAAAFALGLLRDTRAVEPLLGLVRGLAPADQGEPQIEAITAIAKIGGAEGERGLREVLAGGGAATVTTRAAAAGLVEAWRLGTRAPVQELLGYVEDPDPSVRWRALYSLARLRAPLAAPQLLSALQDRDPAVRAVALRGLTKALVDTARIDPRAIADRIRPLIDDRDPHVRINALRAIASFRDSALAARVVPLVSDADIGVAVQAETTLGALGGSVAIEALNGRLVAGTFALRRQALIGLAQADSAAGNTSAAAAAADPDWRWRSVTAEAFAASGARARLEGLLGDADGRVVAQALQGLQRIVPASDTSILPRARQLLSHPDPAVRSGAADLLGRAPSVEDVDVLVQAYQRAAGDLFDDAALSAVRALAEIAKASSAGRLRVANRFVAVVPRPADYLVRRLAADQLPDARETWGPAGPIATGRSDAEYRDMARRWLVPALTGQPNPQVTLETDRGTLVIELLPAQAPLTVAAFLGLVERRFFDGSTWHRVVPNFVVQDGDPRGDGWGGPGFVLRDEVNPIRYATGTMGMALSGPDTGGSQFFITHSPQPHLDGTYTVFGRIVSGELVLQAIAMGDRIRSLHR
ncbi:MAG: peptidylprolyl isomerase [Gemmatimonadetes bacterium]|nr:peptidylprolyl isomerase [Gemmatimonadota bacterium]